MNRILRVRLLDETADGEMFATDVCSMLEAVAMKGGSSLSFHRRDARGSVPAFESFASAGRALREQVGIHRGQRVPAGDVAARIRTVHVAVELIEADEPERYELPIVKTYSYPTATVFHHVSGKRLALARVLSGREDEDA
jgi:protein subunit release factor A